MAVDVDVDVEHGEMLEGLVGTSGFAETTDFFYSFDSFRFL